MPAPIVSDPLGPLDTTISALQQTAAQGVESLHRFLDDPANASDVSCALRIRAVEDTLFALFGRGKLHGTIHTCNGQEFSGTLLARHLRSADFVTSNHRCHGHFIAKTGDWRGLIDEIVGNADGVCAGIGSSQHLWAPDFISNGQQGGLLPVAAGLALDRVTKDDGSIVASFIGEGTLGEGVLYETLNLDSLWRLPHLIICENNLYSQSTPQAFGVAGRIGDRAAAFGINAEEADIWDLCELDRTLARCVAHTRLRSEPSFVTIAAYRLNPHSKGDDGRNRDEIEWFRVRDPVSVAVRDYPAFRDGYETFAAEAAEYAAQALQKPTLQPQHYFVDQLPSAGDYPAWEACPAPPSDAARHVQQLNAFYQAWLQRDASAFFIGEDIADPYGGAFKVSRGLTSAFPGRARTTPISEAAITGVAIGLAITGRRAFVEIMFGDFITYAFDQIINNASKFYHIYNQNLACPVVIRTPMGGRRGYGPTHSQSLERLLIGIDNVCVVAVTSLVDVNDQLAGLDALRCPCILIENKIDYAAHLLKPPAGFTIERRGGVLPTLRIRPVNARPSVTLVAFGGMARLVADHLGEIFERSDRIPELIVPLVLHPLDAKPIVESVRTTGRLVTIEEGATFGGLGAEIVAQLNATASFRSARVGAKPVPVPSAPALEALALPGIEDVCAAIAALEQTN